MVLGVALIGLRATAILGTSLGQQTVKQAIVSSSIFGLGYGGLTNVGYNVSNEFVTSSFRRPRQSFNKTQSYNLQMPGYGRYSQRRYAPRYTSRYSSRYSRPRRRYPSRSYYGRRYY